MSAPAPRSVFLVFVCSQINLFGVNSRADVNVTYGRDGGSVVLAPNSDVKDIYNIVWKVGSNLAMEWHGEKVRAYRHFRDRGKLNTTTGEMTLTGLTSSDSGLYSYVINDRVKPNMRLIVIPAVSKPTLSVTCDKLDKCRLLCRGNTTGADIRWDFDGALFDLRSEVYITQNNLERSFTCILENPVGAARSDPVWNPFYRDRICVCGVLGLYAAAVIYVLYRFFHHQRRSEGTL